MNKKLVIGNWKMNGSRAANAALLRGVLAARPFRADVAVCVPFPYLGETAAALADSGIAWGAQDVSFHAEGAYTGEVSASMLADFQCAYGIVGHSERRAYHGESDEAVAKKAGMLLERGITPVVCVGETLAQRDAGQTGEVVQRQLAAVMQALGPRIAQTVVAYEPVWAIGTGRTASPEQAQAVHALLRAQLGAAPVRILYGGSVKPDNASALFAQQDIDGGLIGGASLSAADFVAICTSVSGD